MRDRPTWGPVLRRAREWAAGHPTVVDGGLAVLVAAITLPVTVGGTAAAGALAPGTGVSGLGWLWFGAVHVPLAWRRRAPVVVFWTVLTLVGVCALLGVTGVFLVSAPLCALFAVARHRSPKHVWPAVGAAAFAVGLGVLHGDPGRPVLLGVSSTLVVTALLGSMLQLRRRIRAERAARLRQERDHQAQVAVADERATIAREVHDIVAHNLAVMVALADGAAATAGTDPMAAAELMTKTSDTGRQALNEMRRLVGLLRADAPTGGELSPQPGLAELDELVARVRAAGPRVVVTHEGNAGDRSPGVGLAVYRIVQEALTNTLKHAGPSANVRVLLRFTPDAVDVEVVDDGAARQETSGGHGLTGIGERAAAYGGSVEVGPVAGAGWRVRARVPYESGAR